jgi:hypothetical protein
MSFTDIVQHKIEARRAGPSPQAAAAAEREARLRTRAAPLITAIEAMRDTLFEDPMFANAIGRPDLVLEPDDDPSTIDGRFRLVGRAAELMFVLRGEDKVGLSIYPDCPVHTALKCHEMRYPQAIPVKGDMAHLDAFMALALDHIADFIADVALSRAAHVLQPAKPAGVDFGGLTRF